jgi:hypothetical protein
MKLQTLWFLMYIKESEFVAHMEYMRIAYSVLLYLNWFWPIKLQLLSSCIIYHSNWFDLSHIYLCIFYLLVVAFHNS